MKLCGFYPEASSLLFDCMMQEMDFVTHTEFYLRRSLSGLVRSYERYRVGQISELHMLHALRTHNRLHRPIHPLDVSDVEGFVEVQDITILDDPSSPESLEDGIFVHDREGLWRRVDFQRTSLYHAAWGVGYNECIAVLGLSVAVLTAPPESSRALEPYGTPILDDVPCALVRRPTSSFRSYLEYPGGRSPDRVQAYVLPPRLEALL